MPEVPDAEGFRRVLAERAARQRIVRIDARDSGALAGTIPSEPHRFSLENDNWQLLGLDTAYDDHALQDPQGAWVAEKLRSNPGRRTMLLSHHQLFSAYGSDGPKLREKLREPLASGRVDAWFWGHEHRCVLYEDGYENVGKARLIGHGGVPVYAHHEPIASPVRYQLTRSFATGWEEWALMGFAVVELSGRHAEVRYFDEWGNEIEEIAETL